MYVHICISIIFKCICALNTYVSVYLYLYLCLLFVFGGYHVQTIMENGLMNGNIIVEYSRLELEVFKEIELKNLRHRHGSCIIYNSFKLNDNCSGERGK